MARTSIDRERNKIVVDNLKTILTQKGLTHAFLAEKLKMTRANVSSWFTGVRPITPARYLDIANVLNVAVDDLIKPMPNSTISDNHYLKFSYLRWHNLNELNDKDIKIEQKYGKSVEFFNDLAFNLRKAFCIQLNSEIMQGETKIIPNGSFLVVNRAKLEHIEEYDEKILIVRDKSRTLLGEFHYNFGEPVLTFWNIKFEPLNLSEEFEILGVVESCISTFNEKMVHIF